MAKEYSYIIDRERIGLLEKNTSSNTTAEWTSITENGHTMRMFCTRLANDFSVSLSEQSELPIQFHDAIVTKAIAYGYKLPGNFNIEAAQYFDTEYERAIREAKRYARRHHTRVAQIIGRDF